MTSRDFHRIEDSLTALLAGEINDPHVSLPREAGANPAETATALPVLLPESGFISSAHLPLTYRLEQPSREEGTNR
jgi:hypothetical protein